MSMRCVLFLVHCCACAVGVALPSGHPSMWDHHQSMVALGLSNNTDAEESDVTALAVSAMAVFVGCAGQTLSQGLVQSYIPASFALLNVWLSFGQALITFYAIYLLGSWEAVMVEYRRVSWLVILMGGIIVYAVDYAITLAIFTLGGAKASLFFVLVMPSAAITNYLLGLKMYTTMQIISIVIAGSGSALFGAISWSYETATEQSPMSGYLWICASVGSMLAMSTWQAFYGRGADGVRMHSTVYTGLTGVWMSVCSLISWGLAIAMGWENPQKDISMIMSNMDLLGYYTLLPVSQGLNVNGYAAIIAMPSGGPAFAECVRLCARLVPWAARVYFGQRPFRIAELGANSLIIVGALMYRFGR